MLGRRTCHQTGVGAGQPQPTVRRLSTHSQALAVELTNELSLQLVTQLRVAEALTSITKLEILEARFLKKEVPPQTLQAAA